MWNVTVIESRFYIIYDVTIPPRPPTTKFKGSSPDIKHLIARGQSMSPVSTKYYTKDTADMQVPYFENNSIFISIKVMLHGTIFNDNV